MLVWQNYMLNRYTKVTQVIQSLWLNVCFLCTFLIPKTNANCVSNVLITSFFFKTTSGGTNINVKLFWADTWYNIVANDISTVGRSGHKRRKSVWLLTQSYTLLDARGLFFVWMCLLCGSWQWAAWLENIKQPWIRYTYKYICKSLLLLQSSVLQNSVHWTHC